MLKHIHFISSNSSAHQSLFLLINLSLSPTVFFFVYLQPKDLWISGIDLSPFKSAYGDHDHCRIRNWLPGHCL